MKQTFPSEDVSEEAKGERDGTRSNRHHFNYSYEEEDTTDEQFHEPFETKTARRKKHVLQEAADSDVADNNDRPDNHERDRNRERHIEVCGRRTEERLRDILDAQGSDRRSVTDCAHTWNEAEPVRKDDKQEDRGDKRKRLWSHALSDDAFYLVVEELYDKLEKVLRLVGHQRHVGRGLFGELEKEEEDDCRDYDRVRNRKITKDVRRLGGDGS